MTLFPVPFRITGHILVAMRDATAGKHIDHVELAPEAYAELLATTGMTGELTVNDVPVREGGQNIIWVTTMEGRSMDCVADSMDALGKAAAQAARNLPLFLEMRDRRN